MSERNRGGLVGWIVGLAAGLLAGGGLAAYADGDFNNNAKVATIKPGSEGSGDRYVTELDGDAPRGKVAPKMPGHQAQAARLAKLAKRHDLS